MCCQKVVFSEFAISINTCEWQVGVERDAATGRFGFLLSEVTDRVAGKGEGRLRLFITEFTDGGGSSDGSSAGGSGSGSLQQQPQRREMGKKPPPLKKNLPLSSPGVLEAAAAASGVASVASRPLVLGDEVLGLGVDISPPSGSGGCGSGGGGGNDKGKSRFANSKAASAGVKVQGKGSAVSSLLSSEVIPLKRGISQAHEILQRVGVGQRAVLRVRPRVIKCKKQLVPSTEEDFVP